MPGVTSADATLETLDEESNKVPHDRYIDDSMKDWTRVYLSGHDILLPTRLNKGPQHIFLIKAPDHFADLGLRNGRKFVHHQP